MKIIFASNNKGKIEQVKQFFKFTEVVGLKEYGIDIDVEETGSTFKENATIKAKTIGDLTNEIVIADDSGLAIDEYQGWPGVYTHRFLGENATTNERNEFILNRMKDLPHEKRKCTVKCVIALYYKGEIFTFDGDFNSYIATTKQGENGFGFDEIVEVEGRGTLACLTNEEKLKLNARSLALKLAAKKLEEIIKNSSS